MKQVMVHKLRDEIAQTGVPSQNKDPQLEGLGCLRTIRDNWWETAQTTCYQIALKIFGNCNATSSSDIIA